MLVACREVPDRLGWMTKKPLEQWQIEDAQRLAALFKKHASSSQADFGAEHGIGSQGMIWQYLSGHRPLNVDAATKFANGLAIKIDDFSPTLAQQIAISWAATRLAEREWPFPGIDRERFAALPDRSKGRAEERVSALIEEFEASTAKRPSTG
jgi:hypothetical protein